MTRLNTVLYTAKVRSVGGRDGAARSSDGRLDVSLSAPGDRGSGTNPEQLLAAGWSACFIGAMGLAARKLNVDLPDDTTCEVEIDLCYDNGVYYLQARHTIGLPGLAPLLARNLVDTAHATCPYSRATRDNVPVELRLA